PLEGGTYKIDDAFVRDAESERYGSHVCNVGCKLAYDLARERGIPAVTVDPPCIDELIPEARYTGVPEFRRKSLFQALSQKSTARKLALALGKKYEDINVVVTHMGGGMSIAAHLRGRVIDVNNGLDGDGPMAPERAGTLPAGDLVRLCFSGGASREEILRKINGRGGLYAYFNTADVGAIEARSSAGDAQAEEILSSMCYQIAKSVGAAAVSLKGRVDALGFTGGLVNSKFVMNRLREWTEWIAPVHVFQEQNELTALAAAALRHLNGVDPAKDY
ncbi:MAG: butyrate kinase, partial [Synergistaceae bacterium]|nr:butyrate kinase [Synergistaceae bacterium]